MPNRSEHHSDHGLLPRILESLTKSVTQRPGGALGIVALVTILSVAMTVRFLDFKTKRSDLIDPSAEYHQRWMEFTEHFGDNPEIVVVVESDSETRVKRVLDDIGLQLEAEPNLFDRVLYRVEPGELVSKALQYVSPNELELANARLEMYAPILDGHWNRAGLESYTRRLSEYVDQSSEEGNEENLASAIQQSSRLCTSLSAFLENPNSLQSPWPEIVSPSAFPESDAFETRYQLTADGKMGFLLVVPVQSGNDFSGSSSSLARLREIIAEYEANDSTVQVGMTGIPVLEADEMERSQLDMAKASGISFIGVGLIILIGFRGIRHPFLALVMLAVGLAWSLGYTTIVVGHLNILSVSFAAILIGLGIDFAIHYLARYLELRQKGDSLNDALVNTSEGVGTGIITAAVTTSLAFLCATFTNFLGVAELGIIAGGGILLCGLATFVVLPALVAIADKRVEPRQLPTQFQGILLRRLTTSSPALVSLITLIAIVAIGMQGFEWKDGAIQSRVQYDSNLLNLQADSVPSVELQRHIFDRANGSLLYAVSIADSPQQSRFLKEQFLEQPTVGRVEEMGAFLPNYPPSETNLLVQAIHARLSSISELPREFPQLDPLSIGQAMEELLANLKKVDSSAAREAEGKLDAFLNQLAALPLEQQLPILSGYQQGMLIALHQQFQTIAKMANTEPVGPHDFPDAVRKRFVSDSGRWQVRVYPIEQIWDEEPLANFLNGVRSVDPEITGTPLQNYEAARDIRTSYFDAALYALAVICLVLLVDSMTPGVLAVTLLAPFVVVTFTVVTIRKQGSSLDPLQLLGLYIGFAALTAAIFDWKAVRNTVLALLPPLAGGLLMFGILGIMGIQLNPANLIVLPLILGIGVDDGVHVIHDYRMQTSRYETSGSTINAVTLTSLTSMVGFGSMMVASHQGLVSLGVVLVVGVGSCLFVSLVTLPAILTLISNREHPAFHTNGSEADDEDSPHVVPISTATSDHVA